CRVGNGRAFVFRAEPHRTGITRGRRTVGSRDLPGRRCVDVGDGGARLVHPRAPRRARGPGDRVAVGVKAPNAARATYFQRNSLSATRKLTTSHASEMPNSPATWPSGAPCSMLARSALLTAVSGSAWMNGCMVRGKLDAEKKTPENTHIGS